MIFCKELNKGFESKEDLFRELKKNLKSVIHAKKSTIKRADAVPMVWGNGSANKAKEEPRQIEFGSKIYPVINTTLYLDSHDDVHLNSIWNKSVKDQQGKISLIVNHDFKVGKVISFPDEVKLMVKSMKWKDLGRDYDGETEALIFESTLTEDSNKTAFSYYKNRRPVQHSICMEYVKMHLAVDSNNKEWEEERKNWEKYLPLIVNREKAVEMGYFWAIEEAKIHKEGSMVLQGSNDVTPSLYELGAAESTPEKEVPMDVTPQRLKMLNELLILTEK